jgi:hypothetical protein
METWEGGNEKRAATNRAIPAGWEKARNQANFAEVQLLLEVRRITGGLPRGIWCGSRSVFGGAVCEGGFILRCCD